jgi:uncharacterized protein YhjY with autotransporter beta-barrel domain
MTARIIRHLLPAITLLLLSLPVTATNFELQELFFAACVNPTAELAERCGETDDGEGNLSGDSESSLNPSQALSGNQLLLRSALMHSENARDRSREGSTGEGARVDMGRFSLLANIGYTWEERDREQDLDEERGYEADTRGADIGFDYRLSDSSTIGVMITWEDTKLDFDRENDGRNFTPAPIAGRINGDRLGITGFASLGLGERGYTDLSLGYRGGENEYERYSVFQESNRVVEQTNSFVRGKADISEFWASANAGWTFVRGAWSFDLHGGLTWTNVDVDSFDERDDSSTGLAMRISVDDQTSLVGTLGGRVQYAISTSSGVWLPYLKVDYAHEFEGELTVLNAGYLQDASSNTLTITGDKFEKNYFIAAAGLMTVLPNGWMPYVDVSYWAGYEDLERTRVQIGLRKEL